MWSKSPKNTTTQININDKNENRYCYLKPPLPTAHVRTCKENTHYDLTHEKCSLVLYDAEQASQTFLKLCKLFLF